MSEEKQREPFKISMARRAFRAISNGAKLSIHASKESREACSHDILLLVCAKADEALGYLGPDPEEEGDQ